MQRQGNLYTFVFALIVCVVCSLALSLVSEGLRSKKELNVALDIKKNILKAVALETPLDFKATGQEILALYNEKIKEIVVDEKGEVVEGKTVTSLNDNGMAYPVYIYNENGLVKAYCIPIEGKGLWSTMYGYLALEADAKTVRGITFYSHGETPGLGAEIDTDWFQNNFKGKKIWDLKRNILRPIIVVKGKVADVISKSDQMYYVDGISGATMTSKGVTAMIDRWLNVYEPYFVKVR